ncbi:MAG: methylated-DNA--[protein]-cysteine S-methyltransferase [Thermomicrobiales bacterium]
MAASTGQEVRQTGIDIGLEVAATKSGVDPCDVACDALPARIVGDLSDQDQSWLLKHTGGCNDCANELRSFDRLGEALATVGAIDAAALEPPPVVLPRRDRVWYTGIESPVGPLILAATAEGLREIEYGANVVAPAFAARLRKGGVDAIRLERLEDARPDVRSHLERAANQLHEYFGGQRAKFDVPLDWGAMAPFQRAVLEATAAVPFGHLDTYAGIARKIGKPGATRAVGNALGRNPIPVIVPCHRVIRSDATIGGYTGGLGIKQHLLSHEGVMLR